jgi:hypothetical protein
VNDTVFWLKKYFCFVFSIFSHLLEGVGPAQAIFFERETAGLPDGLLSEDQKNKFGFI